MTKLTKTKTKPGRNLPARAPTPKAPVKTPKGTLPAGYDYGAAAGAGAEDITSADLLLPFIRIAQANGPEVNKRHEKYIEGCEAGMFFNVSTRRLYSGEDGFKAHLCYKNVAFAEFIPRDDGGGFVGQWQPDDPNVIKLRQEQGKFGKLKTENGTELVETHYAYLVVTHEDEGDEPEIAVMPLSSTGITPFKQGLMQLKPLLNKGVPIYAVRLRVTTRFRKNKEGEFFVPNFMFDGATPSDYLLSPEDVLLEVCAELRESVVSGRAKVDTANLQDGVDDDAGTEI